MRAFLKDCTQRTSVLLDFLKHQNEALLFVALVVCWMPFKWLLIKIDPTSAPIDFGVLDKVYLAAIIYAGFSYMIWMGVKINVPAIYNFWEGLDPTSDSFTKSFNEVSEKWKLFVTLGYLFLQVFFASACLIAACVVA